MITESKPQLSLVTIMNNLADKLVFPSDTQEEDLKRRQIQEALELAIELHKNQTRQTTEPYINHILRVTNRLVDEYGVQDADVVIAALLHDSVEDQSEGLSNLNNLPASRENALRYISETFGGRVAYLVDKLSKEEDRSEMTNVEWNNRYAEKIKEIIYEDEDLLKIKLSDFSDNALKVSEVDNLEKRKGLSQKYYPVVQIFINRIKERSVFPKDKEENILQKLEAASKEMQSLI